MYTIDRLNRLLRNYGHGEIIGLPYHIHDELDHLDYIEGLDTTGGHARKKNGLSYATPQPVNYVGARIALHERHAAYVKPDPARGYFWLGASAESALSSMG